jgi:hypothetical protein
MIGGVVASSIAYIPKAFAVDDVDAIKTAVR